MPPPSSLWVELENTVVSLLIGVGALFLAVIASVIVDPRSPRADVDHLSPTIDATVLPI